MPYKKIPLGNGLFRVESPNGVHAKATTSAKADAQIRLLEEKEKQGSTSKKQVKSKPS
jgi:hypothetical protein